MSCPEWFYLKGEAAAFRFSLEFNSVKGEFQQKWVEEAVYQENQNNAKYPNQTKFNLIASTQPNQINPDKTI